MNNRIAFLFLDNEMKSIINNQANFNKMKFNRDKFNGHNVKLFNDGKPKI